MKSHSLNELKEGPSIKETQKMRLPYINSTMEDALNKLKDGGSLKHSLMRGCDK